MDCKFIARLAKSVPVLPVLAKADSMTTKELDYFRKSVRETLSKVSTLVVSNRAPHAEHACIYARLRELSGISYPPHDCRPGLSPVIAARLHSRHPQVSGRTHALCSAVNIRFSHGEYLPVCSMLPLNGLNGSLQSEKCTQNIEHRNAC